MSATRTIFALSLLTLGAWGPWSKKPDTAAVTVAKVERPKPLVVSMDMAGATSLRADVNSDGMVDITVWSRDGRVIRKDYDLNSDGRADLYSFFDASGALSQEEIDADFDGKVDWVDRYQGGARVTSETDTDFDGNMDVFAQYAPGRESKKNPYGLSLKERDVDGDGEIDYCTRFPVGKTLVYDEREENVVQLRDTNGDRNPDYWEGLAPGAEKVADHPCALDDGSNMCLSVIDTLAHP